MGSRFVRTEGEVRFHGPGGGVLRKGGPRRAGRSARLLEQRPEPAAAAASFGRAVELARRGDRRLDLAYALLLLARLKRRQRDYLAARSLVREAGSVLAACRAPGWLRELLARTERSLQLTAPRRRASGPPSDPDLSERELVLL